MSLKIQKYGFENLYFVSLCAKKLVNHILSLVFANILSKTLDEHVIFWEQIY